MKTAIFSDIHGNLPALEAVLKDIEAENVDTIFCLGDLVNFAPWPNEVIELLRSRNITVLCGNHDEGIGLQKESFTFSYHTQAEYEAGLEAIACTNSVITIDNRRYLQALPHSLRLDFDFLSGKASLLLTHGSPRNVEEYIFENYSEKELLELMDEYQADILIMRHTHRSYHRLLFTEENNEKIYKHAINAGSAGKPKDADSRAAYLLLELNENSSLFDPSTISVQIKRVAYDVQKTQRGILESNIPDIYAELLIKA